MGVIVNEAALEQVRAPADETVMPPVDTSGLDELRRILAKIEPLPRLMGPDGEETPLPREVYDGLLRVVEAMAAGAAVTIAPVSLRLSTSQAADLLGVSRQTLVRLLDKGVIPYEKPSRHRQLRLSDVLAYQRRNHYERRGILTGMTRQAVEDGLYGSSYEEFREALDQARKQR
ncbi:MAG: helix-turn-helix domain-containing protein [Propionibacteriaceae bacterium]|jgi:excisionase family DNA binding protein|nr:helix-turn-helix domain-containing protein [Propionibacteriaceae bacterium]